jgi:membrane-associated protein
MSIITRIIDIGLNVDYYISLLISSFGSWTYLILFGLIFLETGLVFTPFLPGDSLIFAAGTFAGLGYLNVFILFALLSLASILGDSANYAIGHFIGKKILNMKSRFIKKEYVERTQHFYDKYGAKTIVIARFIPIVRTFAPFLAGLGTMHYWKFLAYNIIGGIAWVAVFLFGGYFFGNIPFVKNNFTLAIVAIIILSMIPVMIEVIKHLNQKKKQQKNTENK